MWERDGGWGLDLKYSYPSDKANISTLTMSLCMSHKHNIIFNHLHDMFHVN